MDELFYRFRDFAVYAVIDTPRLLLGSEQSIPAPYSANQIARGLGRAEKSVRRSLLRLMRTGKAVQTLGGAWYSKESAPPDAKSSWLMGG